MCKFFVGLHASITKRFRLLLEFIKMFLISSILDKRLEKQCWTLQQCWTFATLARSRCQFCKWCKCRYGKRVKRRGHSPFCTRLYDLSLKVYFLENWFLALFQFIKIWETREKCFFHSVVSAYVPFTIFSQRGFYRTEKESLFYLFSTIEGKIKTNFYYDTIILSKQNKI